MSAVFAPHIDDNVAVAPNPEHFLRYLDPRPGPPRKGMEVTKQTQMVGSFDDRSIAITGRSVCEAGKEVARVAAHCSLGR